MLSSGKRAWTYDDVFVNTLQGRLPCLLTRHGNPRLAGIRGDWGALRQVMSQAMSAQKIEEQKT
jgi:hypothetical protein